MRARSGSATQTSTGAVLPALCIYTHTCRPAGSTSRDAPRVGPVARGTGEPHGHDRSEGWRGLGSRVRSSRVSSCVRVAMCVSMFCAGTQLRVACISARVRGHVRVRLCECVHACVQIRESGGTRAAAAAAQAPGCAPSRKASKVTGSSEPLRWSQGWPAGPPQARGLGVV